MTITSVPAVMMLLLFGGAGAGVAVWVFVAVRLALRTSARLSEARKALTYTKTAALLAFVGGVVALPTVAAGRCAFTQVRSFTPVPMCNAT